MNQPPPPEFYIVLAVFFSAFVAGAAKLFLFVRSKIGKRLPTNSVAQPQHIVDIATRVVLDVDTGTNMALRTWLDYVNKQPDRVPHLAVIGPSGSGKTTLVTTVLSDRDGDIVVLTAKEGDSWGGLQYVGIDDDATYTTMHKMFDELYREVKRRLVDTKHNRMNSDWLTIVVDDFSTLVKECPVAADVVKLVARLGCSLRVRLIMLSDSALVKAIGLEGEGETRSNFAFVRLQRGHKGTIEIEGAIHAIETASLHQIARRANLASRDWRNHTSMDGQIGGNHTSMAYQYGSGMPDMDAVNSGMAKHTGMNERDEAILAILRANPSASKNGICAAVGGDRNAVMARIDELRCVLV